MLMILVDVAIYALVIGSGYLLGGVLFVAVRRCIDRRKSREIRDEAERMRAEYEAALRRGYVPPVTTTTTPPPKEDA